MSENQSDEDSPDEESDHQEDAKDEDSVTSTSSSSQKSGSILSLTALFSYFFDLLINKDNIPFILVNKTTVQQQFQQSHGEYQVQEHRLM